MAEDLMASLRSGIDFEELAKTISSCESTRESGGEVGWVGKQDDFLEETLPEGVRTVALIHKPGDVVVVESVRGVHLVKVRISVSMSMSTSVCDFVGDLSLRM